MTTVKWTYLRKRVDIITIAKTHEAIKIQSKPIRNSNVERFEAFTAP